MVLVWHIYPVKLKSAESYSGILPPRSTLLHFFNLLRSCSIKMNMFCISQARMNRSCRLPIFYHLQGEDSKQASKFGSTFTLSSRIFLILWSGMIWKSEANLVFWLSILNLVHLWHIQLHKSLLFFICMPCLKLLINLCWCSTRRWSAGHIFVMSRWFQLEIAQLTWF